MGLRLFTAVKRKYPALVSGAKVVGPFVPVVIVWAITASLQIVPTKFFPPPTHVVQSFSELSYKGMLSVHTSESLIRLFWGAVVGITAGLLMGLGISISRPLSSFLGPLISFLQSIGDIAWLPLFMIWFGFGAKTIIMIVVYTVFFPVLYNVILGIRSVPRHLVNAALTLGARRSDIIMHVLLPGAMPGIVTGIRSGVAYGWRALIAAEMIVGQMGLGFMIFEARRFAMTDRVIVGMIVLGLLWLVTDRLFLLPLERMTIERWGLVSPSTATEEGAQ